jgi:hypothetical protein
MRADLLLPPLQRRHRQIPDGHMLPLNEAGGGKHMVPGKT